MDQKQLWQTKWNELTLHLPPNNFARRAYKMLKPQHTTLLDLGCGNGRDSLYFARKGLRVTAVDWSDSGLEQLRAFAAKHEIANLKVLQQDITELAFKANSFDVIYAHLSLHYFNGNVTKDIFKQLYRILKKDGLLFIKCKSIDDALYGKGRMLEEHMYEFRGHIRHFFDKEYMAALLENFQIVTIRKNTSAYHGHKNAFIEAVAKK